MASLLYEIFEHAVLDQGDGKELKATWWPVQSTSGTAVALVCDATISIFTEEDNFERLCRSYQASSAIGAAHGPLPIRATHASWTPAGAEPERLAVAFSTGVVHVLNRGGQEEAELVRPEWVKAGGLAGAVLRGGQDGGGGTAPAKAKGPELLALGKEAILWRTPLEAASPATGQLSSLTSKYYRPQIDMREQHPKGAFCLAYCASQSTMTALGPGRFTDASGHSVPFSVSVWHLTSSAPFHRLLFSAGAVKASRFESLRRPAWAQITALPQALCSPDGCHVSLLDSSKSLQVLNLGPEGKGPVSLVPIGAGNEDEETALSERQKAGESASPQRSGSERNAVSGGSEESANVHDVAWWSNDALLVSRADGAVTVGKLPGLVNMLGESAEKFGPSPRVTGVVRKRAFVLDGVEEEKEAEGERTEEGLPQGATTARQVGFLGRLSGWFRRPDALAPPIRKWRLTTTVERSPLEMMSVHIRHEEYGAALSLAKLYGLDTDLAYKARWERSDFGPASIGDNLGKIRDRRWVIGECLRRVPKTAEAMRALLQYGLQETNKWRYPEKGDGWEGGEEALEVPAGSGAAGAESSGDGEAWWFRERRLQLLRSSDLLATFLVIHNNRFSADRFALFQAGNLKDLAVQFAQAGSAGPLEVLLKRHTHSLAENWLEVLDSMPETVVPYSIRSLLPGPRAPVASISRRPDWIETEETLAAIRNGLLPASVGESTEELARLSRGLVWPSGDKLSEWYETRAVAIDSNSGLLEHSLYLLTLGADLGVRGLERLSEDVQDLYEVVYGGKAFEEASGAVDLSLVEWLGMDGFERYCTVMSGASKEDVVERLEGPADRVARRWAERQEGTSKGSGGPEGAGESALSTETGGGATDMSPSESFPRKWLLQQAGKGALELVSTALYSQLPSPGVNKRLLSHEVVLETALECVYTCQVTDAWDAMAALLGGLTRPKSLTPSGSPRAQGVGGKGDGVKQGPQALTGGIPSQAAPSIPALALGPAGSKRARVAGFLQSAAERAAGQRGMAGFFSRLPKKMGPGKGEEGGMAEILANLPRTGGETAGANAPPTEFENALETFEGDEGAGLEEDAGHRDGGDDVAAIADVAARERLDALEKRVLRAERHVRAGRILAKQQMARPLAFFLTCDADPSGVRQLIRRLLAWASRSNGPDAQWDALWNDLTALQSDAFTFLDTQYLLSEFVRALLRAGRLSLARGYVSGGRKRPPLLADKAETLVLGAAREYFYSAAALDSIDIRHARECLDLLPGNPAAAADRDLMEALTVHLPKLGVELLPLQYKQLKDKEEALQMALAAHDKAYLKLPDLLHVSILLGLSTSTEQSRIKSLAADAAFASGDIRFALRICLELVDENYHPAWVLAAALGCWAGGMSSENFGVHVGLADRKKLLGFAIANVEDGGMDELLRVWEGVDLALRCEQVLGEGSGAGLGEGYVGVLLGAPGAEAGSNLQDRSEMEVLKRVARLGGSDAIPPIATAFARVLLPGLAKACHFNKASGLGELSLGELERGLSAGMLIRTALGQSGLAVSDELLAHLAGLAWALGTGRASETGAESSDLAERAHSGTQFENVGLSCLLAIDPNEGASFVEKAVQQAQAFAEVERATRLAIYFYGIQALTLVSDKGPREIESLLHLSTEELLAKMRERPDRALEKRAGAGGTEPGFKKKGLDYGARLAALKDAKGLEGVLPGVDVDRFASGDQEHQQELVLSLVAAPGGPERAGSQPPETRTFEEQSAALRKALALAERYGVDTWRVLIRHVQTLILSDWPDSEVASGVKESREGLSGREVELMHVLTSDVWPALGGARHNRLALLFSLKHSLWRKLPSEAQTDFAKSWTPPGSAPSFPDFFAALRCANLILLPSAPEADFKELLGPFRNGSLSGVLDLVQNHVTLQNAEHMVGAVQELERAFSAKSDATPGRIFLAAVRRRFADVITEGIDGSKEGSAAIRGGARSESGKEVPKIPALASAYDDSKSAIGKLGPEDLEGLFSDVLRWAYDAGSTFKPVEVLGFRTRLYEDASGLFTAAGEGNPRSRGACEKLAEGFAESGAVLKAVKGLRESGDVSDSQAAAAERSVPFWPANDARSGAEREEKRVGGSSGGARESALKALVSVGVPYRHIEKVWTELQEREPQRGDREGQSKFEEMGSPELAQSGGLTGQVKGGLAAVYRSALEEALTQGSGSALAGLKDGLELVLAGLAEKENGDDGSGLDGVRREVWAQVKAFTDDSGVPLRRKIQTLELLNSLEDRPGQGDKSRVWKGWRAPPGSAETKQGVAVPGSKDGGAHPPKTSLLLLKTAEIVQGEWPDREVDDVSTVSACEALFRTLVADVSGSATDSSTESGDVREDSAVAGGVFEARAGALFALLRLWEANSAAFGHETGGDVEQEKRGGGGGTAESQGGKSAEALAGAVEGSDGAKSAEGKEGTAISGDESSFAEEKGEAGKDEGRPTVREAEGERDAEKKGSESDGRTEAAAEEAVEDEGRKISRFHGSAKLLLSLLLTSRTPRAAFVVLDRWTGDDVISRAEALGLIREVEETIGSVGAAKVVLMSPLADKAERAVGLLTSWTGTKTEGEQRDSASGIQRKDEGAGEGGKESESRVESGQVSEFERGSKVSESLAAARREFDKVDSDLLGLVLAHGLLPKIALEAGAPLLHALCLAVTPLARDQQQLLLSNDSQTPGVNPLAAVAFSCLVAELAACQMYGFAGALVLQYLRVPPALATWDGAPEALLRYLRYLKRKLPQQVRIARGLNRALSAADGEGLSAGSYLISPVEKISKRVVRLSSKALNALVQDLK